MAGKPRGWGSAGPVESLLVQRAGAPDGDLLVEIGAGPADLALADARFQAEGGDQVVDLAVDTPSTQACITTACSATSMRRRGANREGKHDPARTFGRLTVTLTGGGHQLLADAVALGGAGRSALVRGCADVRGRLGVDQCLQHRVQQSAH